MSNGTSTSSFLRVNKRHNRRIQTRRRTTQGKAGAAGPNRNGGNIWARGEYVGRRERARRHQRNLYERQRADSASSGNSGPNALCVTGEEPGVEEDPIPAEAAVCAYLPATPTTTSSGRENTQILVASSVLSPSALSLDLTPSSSKNRSKSIRHDSFTGSEVNRYRHQQQHHHNVSTTVWRAAFNNENEAAIASMTSLGNANGRERDRVTVAEAATRGGGSAAAGPVPGVGGGRGSSGRGAGGPLGTQRIITPKGEGRGGGGGGGGRIVDGRGGGANGTDAASAGIRGGVAPRDMEETCRKICKTLKEDCKVNFLALDFDLTIVDIHTSGRWPGTPEQLAQRIRPFFQSLIPVAVSQGMYLGVVTFSPQVSMISRVLKVAFPDVASQIPIRGDDFSWDYEGRGATDGKQSHMASAVEELTQTHAASITRASTLLIDDDVNNVKIALSEGVKAVWCNPKDSSTMIAELIGLGGNPRESDHGAGRSNGGDAYRRMVDEGYAP